jgi:hypothetical protein
VDALKVAALVVAVDSYVGHLLFIHLALIDELLDTSEGNEPVDLDDKFDIVLTIKFVRT